MTSKGSEDVEAMGERRPLLTQTTEDKKENVEGSILHDVLDTLKLGVPIFFSMLSWVGMKTTDSALLGHVSAKALSAAALSDLVRCTQIFDLLHESFLTSHFLFSGQCVPLF